MMNKTSLQVISSIYHGSVADVWSYGPTGSWYGALLISNTTAPAPSLSLLPIANPHFEILPIVFLPKPTYGYVMIF